MKKLSGALAIALMAACGGGSDNPKFVDASVVDGQSVCNPKAAVGQQGCNAGEKCTWISDQDDPPIGHVGCAPNGTIAIGSACTDPPAGPMGYDQCVGGAVCLAGVCKQICDLDGGQPTCDQNHSCTRYADFFEVGGTAVAGVCDPACDPLTQELKIGTQRDACGSAMPTMPTSGCFGYDEFSCAPTGMNSWGLTDRAMPRTNASGNPYLNGCAPGFIPFFFEMTGSTKTLCSGFCAAQEVNSATPNAATAVDGVATAIGKLPTMEKQAGDATCAIGKKGARDSSECKFIWPYLEDDAGDLNDQFENGPLLDTLGICMAIEYFRYDSNMDMMPDAPYKSCKDVPARSASTPTNFDDATDWLCVKRSNWAPQPMAATAVSSGPSLKDRIRGDVRLPKDAPMESSATACSKQQQKQPTPQSVQ